MRASSVCLIPAAVSRAGLGFDFSGGPGCQDLRGKIWLHQSPLSHKTRLPILPHVKWPNVQTPALRGCNHPRTNCSFGTIVLNADHLLKIVTLSDSRSIKYYIIYVLKFSSVQVSLTSKRVQTQLNKDKSQVQVTSWDSHLVNSVTIRHTHQS